MYYFLIVFLVAIIVFIFLGCALRLGQVRTGFLAEYIACATRRGVSLEEALESFASDCKGMDRRRVRLVVEEMKHGLSFLIKYRSLALFFLPFICF